MTRTQFRTLVGLFMTIAIVVCAFARPASAQSWPYVPQPIHDIHVDRIAIWLELSPEQEHAVRAAVEQYRESWELIEPELQEEVSELFEAYWVEHRALVSFNLEEIMSKLHRRASDLRWRLEHHDKELFDRIARFLTDDQLDEMPRVRRWRQRAILTQAGLQHSLPPESGALDVLDLMREQTDRQRRRFLSSDEHEKLMLTSKEIQRIKPAMERYEVSLIAALDRAARTDRSVAEKHYKRCDMYARSMRAGHSRSTHPELFDEMVRLEIEVAEARYKHAKAIRRVNRIGLDEIMSLLPRDKARRLKYLYMNIAYPDIVPDLLTADWQYRAALDLPDLGQDQHEALIALQHVFQDRHDVLTEKMARSEDAYIEAMYLLVHDNEEQKLRARVKRNVYGLEREQHNEAQLNLIAQVLMPEQIEQVPSLESLFEQRLSKRDPRANRRAGRHSKPQRPWYDPEAGFRFVDVATNSLEGWVRTMTQKRRERMREVIQRSLAEREMSQEERDGLLAILDALDMVQAESDDDRADRTNR